MPTGIVGVPLGLTRSALPCTLRAAEGTSPRVRDSTIVSTATPALQALDVTVRFGEARALAGVSLAVGAGECVALVGESGAGKTTLLRCFNRLTEPSSGHVEVNGRRAAELDAVALRREIGYVPQDGGLLPHWTVARNVGLVPWLRATSDVERRVEDCLELVGLPVAEFGARRPARLSGGQRQRVAIARALASHPEVVLLDEHYGALDALTRHELVRAFAELRARLGFTAVLVTHDVAEAFALAERVAVMRGGRIEQTATPAELRAAPATDYVGALLARAGVA
jgi:osmoprotectant transport system ATP-binding protein